MSDHSWGPIVLCPRLRPNRKLQWNENICLNLTYSVTIVPSICGFSCVAAASIASSSLLSNQRRHSAILSSPSCFNRGSEIQNSILETLSSLSANKTYPKQWYPVRNHELISNFWKTSSTPDCQEKYLQSISYPAILPSIPRISTRKAQKSKLSNTGNTINITHLVHCDSTGYRTTQYKISKLQCTTQHPSNKLMMTLLFNNNSWPWATDAGLTLTWQQSYRNYGTTQRQETVVAAVAIVSTKDDFGYSIGRYSHRPFRWWPKNSLSTDSEQWASTFCCAAKRTWNKHVHF